MCVHMYIYIHIYVYARVHMCIMKQLIQHAYTYLDMFTICVHVCKVYSAQVYGHIEQHIMCRALYIHIHPQTILAF